MLCGGFCMRNYLLKYISENYKIIKILCICILIGLIIGIVTYQMLNKDIKMELINSIKSTLDISKGDGFESINILKNGITSNLLLMFITYLAAITLIAPICICSLNILKGFALGIYIPTLFAVFGVGKGLLVVLIIVILPNLIYIPSYIYTSVNAINFHYSILESNNKLSLIVKETYKLVISFSLITLSIIIEQLASYGVLSLYL